MGSRDRNKNSCIIGVGSGDRNKNICIIGVGRDRNTNSCIIGVGNMGSSDRNKMAALCVESLFDILYI